VEKQAFKNERHNYKVWKKKNQVYYNFLKEIDFCAFDRFNQILKEATKKDPLQELFNLNSPEKEKILMKNEYQFKFAKMMEICFDVGITTISQLDVEKVMQQFECYDVGENLDPIEAVSQKVDNRINFITKSAKLSDDYNSKIETNQIYFTSPDNINDSFLMEMNFEKDIFYKLMPEYKTTMKKNY
jgi:hypothetical protein